MICSCSKYICRNTIDTVDKDFLDMIDCFRPGIRVKYFLWFPQTNLSPEKLTQKKVNSFSKFQFLNDKIYKTALWQFWQNWCFGQFQHPKIEVLQIRSGFFMSVSLVRSFLKGQEKLFYTHSGPQRYSTIILTLLQNSLSGKTR